MDLNVQFSIKKPLNLVLFSQKCYLYLQENPFYLPAQKQNSITNPVNTLKLSGLSQVFNWTKKFKLKSTTHLNK